MRTVRVAPRYSRRGTFAWLTSVITGVFVMGLVLPYALGDPPAARPTVDAVSDADDRSASTPAPADRREAPVAGTEAADVPADRPQAVAERQDPGDAAQPADEPDAEPAGPEEPAAPAEQGPLTASDRGVTADTITIGYMVNDSAALGAFGAATDSSEEQERRYQFWADYINREGGVVGRQLELVFGTFDVLDRQTYKPACLAVTEDDPSFLVIDVGAFREALCITEEHETLFYAAGANFTQEYYDRSEGRLFTVGMGSGRIMRNQAQILHDDGTLAGKTIGVVFDSRNFSKFAALDELIPYLEGLGYEVAITSELDGVDAAQGSSQIPFEVNRHRVAGVDLSFQVASSLYTSQWAQEADKQRYYPLYVMSEISGNVSFDTLPAWPDNMDAIGTAGLAEPMNYNAGRPTVVPPIWDECRRIYREETGNDVDPASNDGNVRDEWTERVAPCISLLLFREVAERTGFELTMEGWSQSATGMGTLDYWFNTPQAEWRPGKYDATNMVRKLVWENPCPNDPRDDKPSGCFVPRTDWFRAPVG